MVPFGAEPDMPNLSEPIRRLVEKALADEKPAKKEKPKG